MHGKLVCVHGHRLPGNQLWSCVTYFPLVCIACCIKHLLVSRSIVLHGLHGLYTQVIRMCVFAAKFQCGHKWTRMEVVCFCSSLANSLNSSIAKARTMELDAPEFPCDGLSLEAAPYTLAPYEPIAYHFTQHHSLVLISNTQSEVPTGRQSKPPQSLAPVP